MLIGIMGKIGSGKSICVNYLKNNCGFIVYSCDDIAKNMFENGETEYIKSDANNFFLDEKLQEECRNTLHKKVFEKIFIEYDIEKKNNKNVNAVIETALPNDDFINKCDKTILVYNDFDNKIDLLIKNRNYTIGKINLIYNSQKYYEKFYNMADYKIENNKTLDELITKLREVINEVCIICK